MDAAKAEMKARMAEAKLKQQQKLNQVSCHMSCKTTK